MGNTSNCINCEQCSAIYFGKGLRTIEHFKTKEEKDIGYFTYCTDRNLLGK